MSTIAFLFPGQGSQYVGMGRALAESYAEARQVFQQADDLLGIPLSRIAWEGPESALNDTVNTQPALLTHSIAAWRVLRSLRPEMRPAAVAGHSLGELSALVAAEALPFEAALRLVRRRGELMKEAGERAPGGMAAILGLDVAALEGICAQASAPEGRVQIANDNCPGQVVISGQTQALERALEAARQAGARRVVRLAVSIAAHSALMQPAQQAFNQAVEAAPLQMPRLPVVGNVSARPLRTPAEIRADLQAQLTSRVRWTETIAWMTSQGVDTFIELGSGSVLTGLTRRIARKSARYAFGEPQDFAALAGL